MTAHWLLREKENDKPSNPSLAVTFESNDRLQFYLLGSGKMVCLSLALNYRFRTPASPYSLCMNQKESTPLG